MKPFIDNITIDNRINEMAQEIIAQYSNSKPLFVSLLRGAAPFTAKLMFAVSKYDPSFHPEVDYMTISTYGDERIGRTSQIIMDLSQKTTVKGRTVIVLDDVLDQGITAAFCEKHLLNKGAAKVELIVLAQKDVNRSSYGNASMYGFFAPNKWLVGMGMDDASVATEGNRWLDYIAIVE